MIKLFFFFFYSKYSDSLTIFQVHYKHCQSQHNNQYLKSIQTLQTYLKAETGECAYIKSIQIIFQ